MRDQVGDNRRQVRPSEPTNICPLVLAINGSRFLVITSFISTIRKNIRSCSARLFQTLLGNIHP